MTKIKAEHITSWNHKNSKFKPNDTVEVAYIGNGESKKLTARVGQIGKVVASSSKNGLQRGSQNCAGGREFTRYYVEFADGYVGGFHSHFLTKKAD